LDLCPEIPPKMEGRLLKEEYLRAEKDLLMLNINYLN